MAAVADGYSRLVSWLKILLPLLALGILSTVFLLARTVDPSQTIPYAKVDVDELARTQRLGAPSYSGLTADGASVSFKATAVHPNLSSPGNYSAANPQARIEMREGGTIEIRSTSGILDQAGQIVTLTGQVRIDTSDGYHLQTETATTSLDATRLETESHVSGQGPFGTLEAGRGMLVKAADGGYVLRFEKGVDVVYRPLE